MMEEYTGLTIDRLIGRLKFADTKIEKLNDELIHQIKEAIIIIKDLQYSELPRNLGTWRCRDCGAVKGNNCEEGCNIGPFIDKYEEKE